METVFEFTLPRGYVDGSGGIHKKGKMRLATAGDEISAAKDPRAISNPAFISIIVLSKVITELEGIEMITASTVEKFFTADVAFLQDMYQKINDIEIPKMTVVCPHCGENFQVPLNFTQEG